MLNFDCTCCSLQARPLMCCMHLSHSELCLARVIWLSSHIAWIQKESSYVLKKYNSNLFYLDDHFFSTRTKMATGNHFLWKKTQMFTDLITFAKTRLSVSPGAAFQTCNRAEWAERNNNNKTFSPLIQTKETEVAGVIAVGRADV